MKKKAPSEVFTHADFQFRRQLSGMLGLGALLSAVPVWAQGPAKKGSGASSWRLLINEAVAGDTNFFLLTSHYQPMADFISQRFKGKQIGIEPVLDIKRFMTLALAQSKPDLIYGKSVNQLAKLVRDNGYQPLVRRPEPYKAAFIVDKASPLKSLADVARANKIIMPDEYAATTAVAKAELRRNNINNAGIIHTRFQEAVAQQVQGGFAQVGAVNSTIARKWVEQGGRVLAETQPVVNASVLASPDVPADTVQQLREVLLSMNAQASSVLDPIGVKEWVKAERQEYLALLDYTKE